MPEWLYKATEELATLTETRDLLDVDGFIARSAYTEAAAKAPNVWQVKLGHIIHVYYRVAGQPIVSLGSWMVALPKPGRDAGFVQGSGLVRVADQAFQARLCSNGAPYQVDPVLKVLTGWSLTKRGDLTPPSPQLAVLQGRQTLMRYP